MFNDFTKLECPFIRKTYQVDKADWKKYGHALKLRSPEVYLVTPEFNPGYEWVIDHPETMAIEKLDGSNVGILMEKGRIKEIQNRKNEVDPLQVIGGRSFIMDGVFAAADMGILHKDGLQYGELLGPKLQSNPYGLPRHLWYPFTKARTDLRYNSFDKYPREFWGWSEWFRLGLQSLLTKKKSTKSQHTDNIFAEGVIFTNRQLGCDQDHPRMSKLRRDMFYWYYSDKIHILGLEESFIEDAKKNGILLKGYF